MSISYILEGYSLVVQDKHDETNNCTIGPFDSHNHAMEWARDKQWDDNEVWSVSPSYSICNITEVSPKTVTVKP